MLFIGGERLKTDELRRLSYCGCVNRRPCQRDVGAGERLEKRKRKRNTDKSCFNAVRCSPPWWCESCDEPDVRPPAHRQSSTRDSAPRVGGVGRERVQYTIHSRLIIAACFCVFEPTIASTPSLTDLTPSVSSLSPPMADCVPRVYMA